MTKKKIEQHVRIIKGETKPKETGKTEAEIGRTADTRRKVSPGRPKTKEGERIGLYLSIEHIEIIRKMSKQKKQSLNVVIEDMIDFAKSKGFFNLLEIVK